MTSRIVFHFKDGSLHDETAVYTERQQFRLVSDHLVQTGPAFPRSMDVSIDARTGRVVVRSRNERGEAKEDSEQMTLPDDIANGLVLTLLKNVTPGAVPQSFSYVAATPKPMLVKLALHAAGPERFSTGGQARSAMHYVLKVDIGGIEGLIAPLVGKQRPPRTCGSSRVKRQRS